MEDGLLAFARWLDSAGIGAWSRTGRSVYPAANSLHLLGLVMLVGSIAIVDLRFVGLWPRLPAQALSRALTSLAVARSGQ